MIVATIGKVVCRFDIVVKSDEILIRGVSISELTNELTPKNLQLLIQLRLLSNDYSSLLEWKHDLVVSWQNRTTSSSFAAEGA